jgi:predicted Zn-ribbon and HTH transcriptional regulator
VTRRQEIIEILKGEALSLQDLSILLKVHIKEILEDIPHIEKSVQPQERLIIVPSQCQQCGFTFKERRKIKTPSRCPKCKGTWIKPPLFQIQDA